MDISSTNTSYAVNDAIYATSSAAKRVKLEEQALQEMSQALQEDVVYTRGDFYNQNFARLRVTVGQNGVSAHPSKTMVQNYINNGMTALEAVQAYKAHLAYGVSSNVNGVSLLSTHNTST